MTRKMLLNGCGEWLDFAILSCIQESVVGCREINSTHIQHEQLLEELAQLELAFRSSVDDYDEQMGEDKMCFFPSSILPDI